MEELPELFQQPPPRRWPWVIGGIFLLSAVGVAGYVGIGMYWPASKDGSTVTVVIAKGQSSTDIAKILKTAGVIRSSQLFELYGYVTGRGSRLQPGTYQIARNLTPNQVFRRLTAFAQRPELTLTILEGWSNRELGAYLEKQGVATAVAFSAIVERKAAWWDEYDFLSSRPADRDLEGYLFPDTYKIFANASVESLVRKMLDTFGR